MDWDGFQVFLAVARAGRISPAAKQLGVEHTTISRRLSAFESELGVRLFYRTAGGYRLTAHGESALAHAEAMERAALGFRARTQESAGDVSGRVRLALLDELATHWLAPALPAFSMRLPGVTLELVTGIQRLDLSRGEADLAVRTPRPRQPGLSAVRLGTTTSGLYACKALLGGKRLAIEDVASAGSFALLVFSSAYHALQSAPWFQPVLAAQRIALASNSAHALLAAAREGVGVAVLPRMVARKYADLVPVSADLARHDQWLAIHPELRRDPKVRAVADLLKRLATGPDGMC